MEGSSKPARAGTLDEAALAALVDLLGGDSEALADVVDAFLEEAPVRIAEVGSGVDAGDAALTRRAAHTLKSNALTFGAEELAELSREIEARAATGELAQAGELVHPLETEWSAVLPALRNLRERGAS
jgi:HPt (histidine-containing phosphotransfer) domain-containing protein